MTIQHERADRRQDDWQSKALHDAQINAKYESGTNKLILEHDRIKLPKLVEKIKHNSQYMMISSDWSSSWNEITKSKLIESFLINIPVTPIIVFEKEYNIHQVIDGRERLKTIADFYSDRLTLIGLEIETDLDKCTYSTLSAKVREQLDRRSLFLVNCISVNDNLTETEIKRLINAIEKRC